MKVKHALEMLNELPLEAEICAQWYEKDDMENADEPISEEVWSEALRLMDKYDLSDMRYILEGAIAQAKESKE